MLFGNIILYTIPILRKIIIYIIIMSTKKWRIMKINREILKKYGISMVDIAKATGIAHPTVCTILDEKRYEKIQKEGNRLVAEKKIYYQELLKN